MTVPKASRRNAWSDQEVLLIVEDYFGMLAHELRGEPCVKVHRNAAIRGLLANRSAGSVERKHQNISAILRWNGLPFIDGYKPLGNVQRALVGTVEKYLSKHEGILELVREVEERLPTDGATIAAAEPREVPAPRGSSPTDYVYDALRAGLPRNAVDYFERERENRRLGLLGEEFVMDQERLRLMNAGLRSLAKEVRHVSKVEGDHVGYDIRSFDPETREPIAIEVKTTNFNARRPFIISRHEVEISRKMADRYRLFRVFHFTQDPHYFVLPGSVAASVKLEPRSFLGLI